MGTDDSRLKTTIKYLTHTHTTEFRETETEKH